MHQGHFGGNIGQVKRFLDRGIAASDDSNFLVSIKETVAGGACGDAAAFEFLLRVHAEISGAGGGNSRRHR